MKKNEVVHLLGFLEELSEYQSNAGCNDHEMPNTPENRELLINAIRCGMSEKDAEQYIGHMGNESSLMTSDFIIFDYLVHCLEEHFGVKDE